MSRFLMRVFCCLISVFLASLDSPPAQGWELELKGAMEWRYRYIARTGPNDLFGNANSAQAIPGNGTSIGLAGPQALAIRLEGFSPKGSDAAYAEQRFFLEPVFRLNEAVTASAIVAFQGNLNANYAGGGANWGTNPHYNGWMMIDSRDLYAGTGIGVPVLRAMWGRVYLPWGTLLLGSRPSGFGMGWALHQGDSNARSVALIVPYGPLNFVYSQYLHSDFRYSSPNDDRNARKTPFTHLRQCSLLGQL